MDPHRGNLQDDRRDLPAGLGTLRTLQYVAAGIAGAIGATALVGWLTGVSVLASLGPGYKPMSPVSAIIFVSLASALALRVGTPAPRGRAVVLTCSSLVALASSLELLDITTGIGVAPNRLFLSATEGDLGMSSARMALLTAVAFLALALAMWLFESTRRPQRTMASVLALTVAAAGFVMLVGYAYEAPFFYGLGFRPTSFPSSAGLWVLGTGIAGLGYERWPFALFVGDSIRAQLARVMVPVTLIPMAALTIAQSVAMALGIGEPPLVVAGLFLFTVALVTAGVLRAARTTGGELESARHALQESERWLNESQRIAGLGHGIWDIEGDSWRGSPALDDVLGIDAAWDRTMAGWLNIVHRADRDRVSRYLAEEVMGGHARFDLEYRIVRPRDHVERWVHGIGTVEWSEDGRPGVMFGIIQDITGHKLAEAALNRERAMLARAEAVGRVGSWRVDVDSGIAEWSDEAVRILGLDPSSETLEPFEALARVVHPDDKDVFSAWVRTAMNSTAPNARDFRIVRPDGEVRWVSAHSGRESETVASSLAVSGIVQDVTERKHTEEKRIGHLEQAANVDRLTGLHNRRGFELLAEQVVATARRSNQGVGLIFCDLDGLKSINDAFGHPQGDQALRDAASILKFTLRSADAMARIGGDEFVVLAVGGDATAVTRLNERLQEGIDFFNSTKERSYQLSMSTGTAWSPAGAPCRLDELKAVADSNMYAEKLRRAAARNGT